MSDRAAIDMTQPFRFLDLPIELRFMVYERLSISSRVVTLSESSLKVSLISQEPLPPIHQICKLLYAEVSPFIRRLRSLAPPPRAVFEVGDGEDFLQHYPLTDTLPPAPRSVCEASPSRLSITKCHEAVYDALDQLLDLSERAAHDWIQHNLGVLLEWTSSFHDYFIYGQTSSKVILEIALSGSASIHDAFLAGFFHGVAFGMMNGERVHVYEAPCDSEVSRGQMELSIDGKRRIKVLYKGVLDKETWEREWT